MSPFKRAFKSAYAFRFEGTLLGRVVTLGFGRGDAVGVTAIGLRGAGLDAELESAPGFGERAALGPGLLAVPLPLEATPVGAAVGIPEARWAAGLAPIKDGPGDFAGAAVSTATAAALAAGAGVTLLKGAMGTAGAGVLGTGDAGVLVGAAVGTAVGGTLSDAIGAALGKLNGTATMDCRGRGTNTGSAGAGMGTAEASGTGFAFEGPCATIFASSCSVRIR